MTERRDVCPQCGARIFHVTDGGEPVALDVVAPVYVREGSGGWMRSSGNAYLQRSGGNAYVRHDQVCMSFEVLKLRKEIERHDQVCMSFEVLKLRKEIERLRDVINQMREGVRP